MVCNVPHLTPYMLLYIYSLNDFDNLGIQPVVATGWSGRNPASALKSNTYILGNILYLLSHRHLYLR